MCYIFSSEPTEVKKKKFWQSKINKKFNKRVNIAYIISLIVVITGFIVFSAVNYKPRAPDNMVSEALYNTLNNTYSSSLES